MEYTYKESIELMKKHGCYTGSDIHVICMDRSRFCNFKEQDHCVRISSEHAITSKNDSRKYFEQSNSYKSALINPLI